LESRPQVVVDLFEHAGQIRVLEPVPLQFDPGDIWPERRRGEAPPGSSALDVVVAVSNPVAKLSNTLALVSRGQWHTRELP
jgi:hypothetical protein